MDKNSRNKKDERLDTFLEQQNKEEDGQESRGINTKELLDTISKDETDLLSVLLKSILTPTLSFSGALQKLLDTIQDDLRLPEVSFDVNRYEPIIESFTDIKAFLTFIRLTVKDEKRLQDLDSMELQLYNKVICNYLGVNIDKEEQVIQTQVNNLNNLFISFLKDFTVELAKNQKDIANQNNIFLRDLKNTVKNNKK